MGIPDFKECVDILYGYSSLIERRKACHPHDEDDRLLIRESSDGFLFYSDD